jgi:hypothetical protein
MCNSYRSSSPFHAVGLGVCVVWLASAAQAGTVETRTAFGRIEMVEEVRTRDPGEPPIMHVATEWTKLHLRWRSVDGLMAVDVVDDGRMIEANVTVGTGEPRCSTSAHYLQYRGAAGEAEIESELRALIARFATWCPIVSTTTGTSYARSLADGASDFVEAEDGLRAGARDLFKRPPTRCLAPRPSKARGMLIPVPSPFDPFPCREPS